MFLAGYEGRGLSLAGAVGCEGLGQEQAAGGSLGLPGLTPGAELVLGDVGGCDIVMASLR